MQIRSYNPKKVEPAMRQFWQETIPRPVADKDKEPFYFLNGPPYTSGQIHIGTAWNNTMKDVVVRYQRMQGKEVFDHGGFDMHGLPNEHATMKQLGLETNEDIHEYGLEKFTQACKQRAATNMQVMCEELKEMGVSLDFENAYQTMSDDWIQSVWWLIKHAHNNGRLYEGLRPMAWDPVSESACAKHELEYKTVEDTSIYVKFKLANHKNKYLIIWTTTPWTIPFNLMIMANPELTYQEISVGKETWIIAKELANEVLDIAEVSEYEVADEYLGEELIGVEYEHFFENKLPYHELKQDHPNIHTVVASNEYVTTEAGTGLVHAAPGCGPEDYEVGVEYDVPAWNLLDTKGFYNKQANEFSGLHAKKDEEAFINKIIQQDALVAKHAYAHEYPHAERTKAPVVYKTTKQWFFKVDDIKDHLIKENNQVTWIPQAGYNAFNSWLENLRDNSITKQRFWGTPLPIWRNDDGDIIVVENKQELEELSGQEIPDLHKPWIDNVTITKDNKEYTRIPDVVDVWVDAGVAHFAALGHPKNTELLNKYWPADFIIEGNDQIRGWFNLLMVTGVLGFDKAPFKNVYMHGMINDTHGRKMSKSKGNYITPKEIIDEYGADASRLYLLSSTRAGRDLSYNNDDCENKYKNLVVYWNIHKYLLELVETTGLTPETPNISRVDLEEKYILSKVQHALADVKEAMSNYKLERVPEVVEDLLDEISRTYIQLVRKKAHTGTLDQQQMVIDVLSYAYSTAIQLLAPVTPFITEAIWQNLKEPLKLTHASVHQTHIPEVDTALIDNELEEEFATAQQLISVLLSARDKAQMGVRWPLKQARVTGVTITNDALVSLIKEQTNMKEVVFTDSLDLQAIVAPDYKKIGKEFGQKTAAIAKAINKDAKELGTYLQEHGEIVVAKQTLSKEYLEVTYQAPSNHVFAEDDNIQVLVDTTQNEELQAEGYVREIMRRIQQARKEADLDKSDEIALVLDNSLKSLTKPFEEEIIQVVGAQSIAYGDTSTQVHVTTDTIQEKQVTFGFHIVDN